MAAILNTKRIRRGGRGGEEHERVGKVGGVGLGVFLERISVGDQSEVTLREVGRGHI